jgi:hypothetical protein
MNQPVEEELAATELSKMQRTISELQELQNFTSTVALRSAEQRQRTCELLKF